MAFLKNLQDIASSLTSTIVTSSSAMNRVAQSAEKGADMVFNVMDSGETITGKHVRLVKIKAQGEEKAEQEKLYALFPDLRPAGEPTPDETHRAEEANTEPTAVAA